MKATEYRVIPIDYEDCRAWCLYKHYAHRIPTICYAFGLYKENELEGICTFGMPPSPTLVEGAMGGKYTDCFLELNRLVVNEGLPKNTLSHFVAQSLQLLPKPMVVVSFADTFQHHHGYIYQATNWIYTGLTEPRMDTIVKGKENMHSRWMVDKSKQTEKGGAVKKLKEEGKAYMKERPRKHRYFYFLGDKRQKRDMLKSLKYPIVKEYPKGDNIRYDASFVPPTQLLLF